MGICEPQVQDQFGQHSGIPISQYKNKDPEAGSEPALREVTPGWWQETHRSGESLSSNGRPHGGSQSSLSQERSFGIEGRKASRFLGLTCWEAAYPQAVDQGQNESQKDRTGACLTMKEVQNVSERPGLPFLEE